MARGPMPAWVPAIVGVVLVVAVGAPLVERWLNSDDRTRTAAKATAAEPGPAPSAGELPPLRFTETRLGAAPGRQIVFDRALPGHVLACQSESHDGGRTWSAMAASGPGGPCGDAPPASWPSAVSAWTQASDGTIYATVSEPGRRPHLRWAPAVGGPWRAVATPGDVGAVAADGARVYVAAGMLGRGHQDAWDWVRWPPNVGIRGVTAVGATVVAWGSVDGDSRGGYVVSRDGGARLQLVIHAGRPAWAALDPHRPSDLLVVGDDGSLTRLRMSPG